MTMLTMLALGALILVMAVVMLVTRLSLRAIGVVLSLVIIFLGLAVVLFNGLAGQM